MRSVLAGIRQLVLPFGAAANSPKIILGPDVPPELVAFYATFGEVPVACFIEELDSLHYHYDLLITTPDPGRGGFSWAHGVWDGTVLNVIEQSRDDQAGVAFGARSDVGVGIGSFDPLIPTFTSLTVAGSPARLSILATGLWDIDGFSAPRGYRVYQRLSAKSSTGAEVLVNTTSQTMDFVGGRAYDLKGFVQISSGIDQTGFLQIHHGTTLAGGVIQVAGRFRSFAGSLSMRQVFSQIFTASANLSEKLTIGLSGGTGANPFALADGDFRIVDVGDALDFSGAPTI